MPNKRDRHRPPHPTLSRLRLSKHPRITARPGMYSVQTSAVRRGGGRCPGLGGASRSLPALSALSAAAPSLPAAGRRPLLLRHGGGVAARHLGRAWHRRWGSSGSGAAAPAPAPARQCGGRGAVRGPCSEGGAPCRRHVLGAQEALRVGFGQPAYSDKVCDGGRRLLSRLAGILADRRGARRGRRRGGRRRAAAGAPAC